MKAVSRDAISSTVAHGLCSGCGLCVSLVGPAKARMVMSEGGFLRPLVFGKLTNDEKKKFKSFCPGSRVAPVGSQSNVHPLWGPIASVHTGFSTDAGMRHAGSSGGVLSALASHLLKSNKVSFVAQIAVAAEKPLENELQVSRNVSDVLRAAGSRYAPSAPLVRLLELLGEGRKFALIGKPCDIAAVRRYGQLDKRVGTLIPYMFSFFCAGIPSQKGTKEILDKLGVQPERVKEFRYRGDGWPGKTKVTSVDGDRAQMNYATSWGTILNRHLQFRCKICPDGTGEFADIVCADAWYGKAGYPDFEEQDGRSLVLARTTVGSQVLAEAIAASEIVVSGLAIEEIEGMQPYQAERKRLALARLFGTWIARKWGPTYWNLRLIRSSFYVSPKQWIRSLAGTVRRAMGDAG